MSSPPAAVLAAPTTGGPLVLAVDAHRLLHEVGSLFGSVEDALAEAVQNAYRARATELRVEISGRTITLTDDGPGLADPADLFTVARSGWAEGVAKDPAGMGAFSLFGLSERVEVTSRPRGAPGGWMVAFGREAFDGVPLHRVEVPSDGTSGLQLRITLKPGVRIPDLLDPGWRHRFPLAVRVSVEGSEPVAVEPRLNPGGRWIPTPVGPVKLWRTTPLHEDESRAVWEHRIVRFSGRRTINRLRDRMPSTLAGAVVRFVLEDRAFEWVVDTAACETAAKLPDRSHLIEDTGLERALDAIAAALLAQVDETDLRSAVEDSIGGKRIIRHGNHGDDRIPVGESLGALGTGAPVDVVLPHLGYVRAERALRIEHLEGGISVSGDDAESRWEADTQSVWVRPLYRTETEEAALLALGDRIPAVCPSATRPGLQDLPLLVIEPERLLDLRSIGQLFAYGLRYLVDGRVLAPVERALCWNMSGGSVHLALSSRWVRAIESRPLIVPGNTWNGTEWVPTEAPQDWIGLHPLPDGMSPIDYVRTSRRFAVLSLRESDSEHGGWPVHFWDFTYREDAHEEVDIQALVRELADLVAQELGPATARLVQRETQAIQLADALTTVRCTVHRELLKHRLEAAREEWDLAPDLLQRIEEAAGTLHELLSEATLARLLGPDEPAPAARAA
jgi:hypothetical protein